MSLKQYTRIWYRADGTIAACHTNTSPLGDDYNPIEPSEAGLTQMDFELDTEIEDLDFSPAQDIVDAAEIRQHMEVRGGLPSFKVTTPRNRFKAVARVGPCTVTAVTNELRTQLIALYTDDEELGTPAQQLKTDIRTVLQSRDRDVDLAELTIPQRIRLAKAVNRLVKARQ